MPQKSSSVENKIQKALKDRAQELDLSDHSLTELPDSISQLTQLQSLNLNGNRLTSLPDSIGRLTQLQYLYLIDNQLTSLPDSIGQLTQLQRLDLRGNQLTSLPDSMRNISKLETLLLHENKELGLPPEILGANYREIYIDGKSPAKPIQILEYYFQVRGGQRALNEAKLILVGRGTVGKTSIVNRLVHDRFRNEKKTEGIKITAWPIKLNGSEDVRLNIWDFGGQEIMHRTHQFFLTERSLYLLVLNGREGAKMLMQNTGSSLLRLSATTRLLSLCSTRLNSIPSM